MKSVYKMIITVFCVLIFSGCGMESDKAVVEDNAPMTEPTAEQAEPEDEFNAVDGAIVVNVETDKKFQTIDGFGAGYTYYSDYGYWAKYKSEIYDLLFKDANLSILRFKNSYDYDEEKKFDPKVEKEYYEEAKKRLEEDGLEAKILMSSWSPAIYVKDSECLQGVGTIARKDNGDYNYELYANYWAELVQAYRDYGIPIEYMCLQNEPDYTAAYESCTFNFEETNESASYKKAHFAVYDAISKLDDPPKILGPDSMSCNKGDIELYMGDIYKEKPESLYGLAHHLYVGGDENDPKSFILNFQGINNKFPDLKKWMTEYYRGNFMTTAQIIQNELLYENLNAYIFWGGVWKGAVDKELDNLIGVDSAVEEEEFEHPHGYVIGEKYYSMRHFSEYILPDYVRVNSTLDTGEERFDPDQLSCSAFISPDNKTMTLVAINDTDEAKKLQLNLKGFEFKNSKIILTDYKDGIDTAEFYKEAGSLDENKCYELSGHGIITLVLTN